jgi:hypothetical protein
VHIVDVAASSQIPGYPRTPTDPGSGLKPGVKWKTELVSANSRGATVIGLLSTNWESSPECSTRPGAQTNTSRAT